MEKHHFGNKPLLQFGCSKTVLICRLDNGQAVNPTRQRSLSTNQSKTIYPKPKPLTPGRPFPRSRPHHYFVWKMPVRDCNRIWNKVSQELQKETPMNSAPFKWTVFSPRSNDQRPLTLVTRCRNLFPTKIRAFFRTLNNQHNPKKKPGWSTGSCDWCWRSLRFYASNPSRQWCDLQT